jgi:hypothetical protein
MLARSVLVDDDLRRPSPTEPSYEVLAALRLSCIEAQREAERAREVEA